MGIKKITYRKEPKERNKRLIFRHPDLKEIAEIRMLKKNFRRSVRKSLECAKALK